MSDTGTLTLTDFLLARIKEDEQAALYAMTGEPVGDGSPGGWGGWWIGHYHHYHRHDPTRVLAECGAKRQIAADAVSRLMVLDVRKPPEFSHTLRLLALPYAEHPDFNSAWRP